MLPLLHGPLPPPEPPQQDASVARQLARRFAHVVTLRHRQRPPLPDCARRRHPPPPRNCAWKRRQGARATRRLEAEREPEPEDASLDASIRSLQAHIASLERSALLRDSATLLWRTNSSAVALDLTREYFLQFECGYDSAAGASTDRFVASVFRPDVLCRDFQGIQAFMDQWEKYTTFHQGLAVQLHAVRLVDSEADPRCAVTVYASGEIGVTFTQDTLKFLYPALLTQSQRSAQARESVAALVGSRGSLPMELVLHFDWQGRVFAFESRVNLVSTLLQVLHSPSAAIHVHQSSLMTADGHWQAATDGEQAAQRQRTLPRQLL
ncbi:vacuolar protein sorting-associated protein 9 [Phytophthora pseudosyringae]|uniref:Vacuolar protein sorting-associated protein 9 n=1 Tax=Phytophthora pseudosyringae TaxID=221518 RepID=A0A8T1VMI0_9STRA|nr:vacuolar protein sorting-associated protein 9 [Phytophthora pseudosyringae]